MTVTRPGIIAAIVAVGILLAVISALFTVDQRQQAIVLQFGEFKRDVREPGLHVKLPFVQHVVYYSSQLLSAEPPSEEVISSDQKRLVVDSYARYRISDPLQFYQSVGDERGARSRLDSIISASLRDVLGNVTLASVLSTERAAIMRRITTEVSRQAKPFGVDVVDVRLRRADLPIQNSQAIYARMQSERQREAQEFRAEGDEVALRVKATADRQRTVLLAEAQRQAEILRGEGEATAVATYADAFGKDRDFFAFYRSMQAYRAAFAGTTTRFVLSPDSAFFRFFGDPLGGTAAPPPVPATPAGKKH